MNEAMLEPITTSLPAHLEEKLASYQAMTVEELEDVLARLIQRTADALLEAAHVVRIMEGKGADTSKLCVADVKWLRLIAHNQMLPEVFMRFGGEEQLMQAISSLSIPDQRRLISGERVPVLVFDLKTGQQTHQMLQPLEMTRNQIRQVFGRRLIRSETQQLAYLHDKRVQEMPIIEQEEVDGIKIDPVLDTWEIGRHSGPMSALVRAVQVWKRSKRRSRKS